MLLTMRLTRLVATPSILGDFGERQLTDWVDWKTLYQQLLSEDRVWDFRDAFLAVSACYGTENALQAFHDYGSSMEDLLTDWQTDSQDESTNLALLDILSLTALAAGTYTGVHYLSKTCVQLAESIGNSLLNNSPDLVQSRAFLRWVIAKAVVNYGPRNFKYFSDYPGLIIFPTIEGVPYYIPVSQENPGWLPLDPTPTSRESLQMALSSAKKMQDYKTEALCLRELALRTEDPGGLLHELGQLQRFKQHNMDGYLVTLLSRYLICRDYSSKENLGKNLEDFGIWKDPSDLVNPTAVAARAVLQHALSQDPADDAGESLGAALRYYQYLPRAFQGVIDCHYPVPAFTAKSEGRGSPLILEGERPLREKPLEDRDAPTPTNIKGPVLALRPEVEAGMRDIESQQTHGQDASSFQKVDQAAQSKTQQSKTAKLSRGRSEQKSRDLTNRLGRPSEVTSDRVRARRQQHRDSSIESAFSTDYSVSESHGWSTEMEHDVENPRNIVKNERVRNSLAQPSGTHSRPRPHPR